MSINSHKRYTASNILYLLLSFPLGVVYFSLIITGLIAGAGTIIVWVGIPILVATFAGIWGMAALERRLAAHLLHIDMPVPPKIYTEHGKMLEWFGLKARDSLTWKSLAYLLIKFPLGIISFCIALTLVVLCVGLILTPLEYLIATYVLQELGIHLTNTTAPEVWLNVVNLQPTGVYEPLQFAKAFGYSILGFVLWFPVRALLNGMADASGAFAHTMLTSSRSYQKPKEERYEQQETGIEIQ